VDSRELIAFIRRKPFRPYRITLSDGRTYDIPHLDMAIVGFGSIIVGLPPEPQKESDAVREVLVSLMHVVQVASIDAAGESQPSQESNGKK
jgi:hypothetical protein